MYELKNYIAIMSVYVCNYVHNYDCNYVHSKSIIWMYYAA